MADEIHCPSCNHTIAANDLAVCLVSYCSRCWKVAHRLLPDYFQPGGTVAGVITDASKLMFLCAEVIVTPNKNNSDNGNRWFILRSINNCCCIARLQSEHCAFDNSFVCSKE